MMRDRNIYHLTIKSVFDIPEIHGDIHRPSDYNLDKVYLMSKSSDVLMDNRDFGVLSGFTLLQPTGGGITITGNSETNRLSYSWSTPTSNIQFDDGYVVISHRFFDEISTHDKTGVELQYPVKVVDYFGILYCPKEKNIINLNVVPDGTHYIYIKYNYDTTADSLLLNNVSRQRTKVSVPVLYTFIGADFYTIELLTTQVNINDSNYYNYVLLGKLIKSGTSYSLELEGYTSFKKLTDLIKLFPLNTTNAELYYKLKNLTKKYYVQSFEDVYNYLDSQPDFTKLEHKYPNLEGTILVNNHFNYSKGTLNNGNNLVVSFLAGVKFIVLLQNGTQDKSAEVSIYSKVSIINHNTFSSSELVLTESTNDLTITNNSGENLGYFIFKIDGTIL
ncbi:MAG: hypothetical protein QXS29_10570 [Nitrososphaeria archaeon]